MTSTPITIPDLGVDWAGTVENLTTSLAVPVTAALGLFAVFVVVRVAVKFIRRMAA